MSSNQVDETEKPASAASKTAEGSNFSFDDLGKFLFGAEAWGRIYSNVKLRRMSPDFFRNFYNFLAKLPWVAAIIVIAAIVFRGLTEHVTVIQALSVPETLQKSGYTPEVAGHRLRDALQDFVKSVNTHMKSPDIALHGELPDIVVPSVGISLDAIMSSIRTMLRSTRSRTIAGEFTIVHDELRLRLRLDGREIYTSDKGVDPSNPDQLLNLAAPKVLEKIQPYFIAAALGATKPDDALAMADDIISRLPETDENVAWSYNLKGSLLQQRKEYDAAIEALNEAIRINNRLVVAHINLGNVLKDQGNREKAVKEYDAAIAIEPTYAMAHYDLAVTLRELGKTDKAIDEYRKAIKYNPKDVLALDYLGGALRSEKRDTDAIIEFSKAIKIDPNYMPAHFNLANTLRDLKKRDEAIAEYKAAIAADPKFAAAHNSLASVLQEQGEVDDAIVEYKEAIKIQPSYVTAHNNLGAVYTGLGEVQEAIVEFQAVLSIEPKNSIALVFLKQLGQEVNADSAAAVDESTRVTEFASKMQYPE